MALLSQLFWLLLLALVPLILAVYDDYRLPRTLEPQHYDLRILTHLDELRFEGIVKIHLLARQSTRNITLHVKDLEIDEERTTVSSFQDTNCVTSIETHDLYEFYTLHLCRELVKNEVYQLEMHFGARLNSSDSGYYNTSYTDVKTKEKHNLAVTQFSPTFARQAFPCFDEPSWKATFNVTLGYHRNYTGLSNMPVLECRDHETLDNFIWCQHETLLRTSTYLVAYAVHDLQYITIASDNRTPHNRLTFRHWMQPEMLGKDMPSVEMAPKLISFFEDLFQLKFPLMKIDQLIAPTHRFKAMENWGLVTFNQLQLAINPNDDLQEKKDSNAFTSGHEYAHQWFGNLVTMTWWNDLWLKEGPSSYFSYIAMDALQPELARGEVMIAQDLGNFFAKDSGGSVPAISKEVRDPAQILEQFSEYVYQKGSLMIRMLHKVLGEDVFYQGIRSYLRQNALGNVLQTDLWKSMQEAAQQSNVIRPDFNLSRAMDSWTLQGGYPLLTLIRDYTGTGNVTLNQTRFIRGKESERNSRCWWIPLRFVRKGLPDFEKTIAQASLECPAGTEEVLTLPDPPSSNEWLLVNPQVSSIFRVNYDEHNWHLINQSLCNDSNFGGIHKLNRAQLVDDILALASVRIRSYDWALDMLGYLRNETEFLPWKRALKLLNDLGALLSGQDKRDFKVYMQQLLSPLYKRLSKLAMISRTMPATKEISFQRFAYSQACHYHVDDCIEQAKELAMSPQEIPSDFREVAYCSFLEEGGEAEFLEVLGLFKNATNAAQQQIWASVLGCSRDFKHFKEFLDFTLESNEKGIRDCYLSAAKTALSGDYLTSQTFSLILSQAKIIGEKFKKKELTGLLLRLVGQVKGPKELQQLNEQLKEIKAFREPLKEALDLGNINQQWQEDCASDFSRALKKHI
ncbi:hypothetical protein KR038_000535 [Drosophila bunnanda]|nr:hypothetical protein KR038_000535 [Drosophila bunnanda]